MIRTSILAGMALSLFGIGAAEAETTFAGTVRVNTVTPQCHNAHAGDIFSARFHPYISGQSDRSEGFSFVYQYGGGSYLIRNRGFDANYRPVESGGLGWGGNFTFPTNQWAQIALVGTRPTITPSTNTVVLSWRMKRPDNDSGGLACIVYYTGVFLRQFN